MHRLDHDIRRPSVYLGAPALNASGFWLRGKTGYTHHVRWCDCGPLRAWLMAYHVSTSKQAARYLLALRKAGKLTAGLSART